MHWTIGAFVIVIVAFLAGVFVQKSYPGTIPVIG
jgi:hypothetical protein